MTFEMSWSPAEPAKKIVQLCKRSQWDTSWHSIKPLGGTGCGLLRMEWWPLSSGGWLLLEISGHSSYDQHNNIKHHCQDEDYIFSEYGVPQRIFSDNGPQFTSAEFKNFAAQYNFEVLHSSPRYPQSNGFAEAMVKVVKGIMSRAQDSGTEASLAMLIYRSTPFKAGVASPAELLCQRKFKDLIPVKSRLSKH